MTPPPIHRWSLALLPWLCLGACGGGATPDEASPGATPAPRGEVLVPVPASASLSSEEVARRFEGLPLLFGSHVPTLGEASQALADRHRVELDDWETEKAAMHASAVLETLLPALLAGDGARVNACLAKDFAGATPLVPEVLELRSSGPAAEVRTAPAGELEAAQLAGPEALLAGGAALRAHLGGDAGVLVLVVSVRLGEGEGFETDVELVLDGHRPDAPGPAPSQVNAAWSVEWRPGEGGRPRVASVRVTRYEQLDAPRAFFDDVSEAAFGATPGWRDDMLRGVDDQFMHIDRQMGVAFQGMQGLAVGDANGDGREDVYVCQQVGLPNRLYLREPDGTTLEVAREARVAFLDVTRSALFVDLEGDGDQDLVLAIGAALVIAYNDGTGTFTDQISLAAEGAEQFYSITAADADRDGDLDLFGCRYAVGGVMHGAPTPYHDANNGATNHYYRNDGERVFTDATEAAGFGANNKKFSLAAIWEDLDRDGDLDLYVVNDFGRNNLWRNDGAGHFEDVAEEAGLVDVGAGMGATCEDFDLDGTIDVYVTNMFAASGLRTASQERFLGGKHDDQRRWYVKHASGNTLLRGRGDGTFEDVTASSGTAIGRWAWGAKFLDFDGDGYADLYVPNGQTSSRKRNEELESFFWRGVIDQSPLDPAETLEGYRAAFDAIQNLMMFGGQNWNGRERNNAYLNLGDGRFVEAAQLTGAAFVEDSRALAVLDWDDDGREDMLLRARTAPRLRLLVNRSAPDRHALVVELEGKGANRDAVGALVRVDTPGRSHVRRIYAGDGYLSQSSKRLVFGLGDAERVLRIEVEWPDGSTQSHSDLAADQVHRLRQGEATPSSRPLRARGAASTLVHAELERNPEPFSRIVLGARLPMGEFDLATFDGQTRKVRSLRGRPVLVHLWTSGHPSGPEALAELEGEAEALAAAEVAVVCLSIDQGAALARARKRVESGPFAELAGYADGSARELYRILLLEVLSFFDGIPLPTSFLLDTRGRLCVAYTGPTPAATIAADAAAVAQMNENSTQTTRLLEGRWRRPPLRDFVAIGKVLRAAGFEDLAAYYEAFAAGSQRGPLDDDKD